MDKKRILIYADIFSEKVQPSAFELLAKAKDLYKNNEAMIGFVALGCNISGIVKELSHSGADVVYEMDSDKLNIFELSSFITAFLEAISIFKPDIILIPASIRGEEIAPTLGIKLKTGVAAHCIDIKVSSSGEIVQLVPAVGGRYVSEIITKTDPVISSIKPGTFAVKEFSSKECDIVKLNIDIFNNLNSRVKPLKMDLKVVDNVPIDKADLVVCGGLGIGSQEDWNYLIKLASLLNGAVGYTRPVVDSGWVEDELQMVGASGKNIRPKVYLGFGISGATHHVCGIKDADTIISANSDANAEVFSVSDYKVVADAPKLIKTLCSLLEKS